MSSSCSNLASAGYSGYEYQLLLFKFLFMVDLSRLKALGQPQEALPKDIAIETLFGAILGIIGAALLGPPLKQISWASEIKTDEMDARGKHRRFSVISLSLPVSFPEDVPVLVQVIGSRRWMTFYAANLSQAGGKQRFDVHYPHQLQDSGEHTVKFTFAFHRAELVGKESNSETKNPFHPCSIGAFFNGVFLLALALSVFLQSIERFVHIERIEEPFLVLVIGCVGLTLDIISALGHHGHGGHSHGSQTPSIMPEQNTDSLRHHIHATHNHTIESPVATHQHNLGSVGVLVHLIGDAVNNVGVIVAALIIWKAIPQNPNRFYADPAASLAISLIIFATLKSGRILLEAAPLYLDLAKVKQDLLAIPDDLSVHDLHVWHLSQSVILASLHVCVPTGTSLEQWEQIERTLQHCFQAYGISHVTISPELRCSELQSLNDLQFFPTGGCSRLPSHDDYGCAVSELKKRKLTGGLLMNALGISYLVFQPHGESWSY
ncbi:hypothetical protein Ac2012v2_005497 [Leucoagaricus gongylophorus]